MRKQIEREIKMKEIQERIARMKEL